jgi:murein DD-endopeptidase MepM/ murein hydrolase activator NlpD
MAALAVGSVLMSFAALPLASADDLKHKKHKVQRHINQVHTDLDESSAQLRHATAALHAAQVKLGQAQGYLAKTRGQLSAAEVLDRQMQAKLVAAVARLEKAQADLKAGREQIAEQQKTLGQIVVQNYQTGDPSLMGLSMVLTSQDPAELTGQLNSVKNVMDKESVILDRLEASKVLLTVQEQEVAAAKEEVAKERAAAAENLKRKQQLEAQAEDAEAKVKTLVGLRADAEDQAEQARAADMAQLKSLEKERDRIAVILKKRAEAARRRAAAAAAAAGNADTGSRHSNGFLDWPVDAPVTSPYGWRIHPIYGYRSLHDGIDLGAACGAPIHAPADGRVIEEYFQTAWGNRLIIDHGFHHGAGVATISNHLSSYTVHQGDYVRRGEVIGYVGTSGWSTGCHLHFTVMENGSPVNPMNWL